MHAKLCTQHKLFCTALRAAVSVVAVKLVEDHCIVAEMIGDNLLGPRPCHMLAPGSGLTESAAGLYAVRHPQKAAGLHVTAVLVPAQTRLSRTKPLQVVRDCVCSRPTSGMCIRGVC